MRDLISQTATWIEDRTGLRSALSGFLFEEIPVSAGWPHVFGSVALFVFLVQALTGVLLALNYAPTTSSAYPSVTYIVRQVAGGRVVHGLHHWGASAMIIVVCLHMAQVFIFGAFRRPREATWIAGAALLLMTLGFGLTGYLLPWDNKAYWGTVVTTRILGGLPVAGRFLTGLVGAKNDVGVVTLTRFYALHTLVLPAATIALIAFHVYLVRRHGITPDASDRTDHQTFYPKQLFRDFAAVFIVFVVLFAAAAFLDVPLERMADPTDISYVPRPEWYFLFLFQLLKVFPGKFELIGTLVLPTLAVMALFLLPFFGSAQNRLLSSRIKLTAIVLVAFSIWAGLTSAADRSTPHSMQKVHTSADAKQWAQIPPQQIAGFGFYRAKHCDSCHNLVLGDPKPGPTLGAQGLQHPKDWIVQHVKEKGQGGGAGAAAVVEFLRTVKPESVQTITAISPQFVRGAQVFMSSACASCHQVDGVGGTIGPALNGLATRRSEEWVRAHFASPRLLSPGTTMPPYRLPRDDERALVEYLFSLPE